MQDLGDKLRLVCTAHRRVKIVGQLIEELEEVPEKREYNLKVHTPAKLRALLMQPQPLNIHGSMLPSPFHQMRRQLTSEDESTGWLDR